ncbi:MAG: MBL fold metallo-hydrolase [Patescibacteria group bacterium]
MNLYKQLLIFVILANILVWMAIFTFPNNSLRIIACDIGQGDAILITYKDFQVLTDGGPDSSVINCLSKYMPFWDRTIEVMILTNPDLDHLGGLISVVKQYKIEKYIKSPTIDSTQSYKVLEDLVGSKGIPTYEASSALDIQFSLMYLDIVYPNQEDRATFKNPQNNYSTVFKLTFKDFEAVFTGDIEEEASDYIAKNIYLGDIDYIKIPHHGSKHGITRSLLEVTKPEIAVISAGKNNKYGHPHAQILEMLQEKGVKILGTYDQGDVVVEIDESGRDIIYRQ